MVSRKFKDRLAAATMAPVAASAVVVVFVVVVLLFAKSWPILSTRPLMHLLGSSTWQPAQGQFGFATFIAGTLAVTFLAMAIAIPICLLGSIYLSEYARERVRTAAKPFVDLLAGIPSVIYGLWGVLVIVPVAGSLGQRFGAFSTGYSVLAGGIVLAIMVFPTIIAVCEEVIRSVPMEAREASMALGATRWQTVKHVVLRSVVSGIAAGIVLGFSRAFGETMAVLMVVGNVPKMPHSLFDPAYPLPALIANNYGEMMSIPLYDSALMLAALILMVVVIAFNVAAVLILRSVRRRLAH